jgi:hypothetical protein
MFFETAGQFTPRQQHNALALQAFQADIRPQPDNLPFIPTAGMRFAQGHAVTQVDFRQHKRIIPDVRYLLHFAQVQQLNTVNRYKIYKISGALGGCWIQKEQCLSGLVF